MNRTDTLKYLKGLCRGHTPETTTGRTMELHSNHGMPHQIHVCRIHSSLGGTGNFYAARDKATAPDATLHVLGKGSLRPANSAV